MRDSWVQPVVVCWFLASAAVLECAAAEADNWDSINAKWKERAAKIHSAHFEWIEVAELHPGYAYGRQQRHQAEDGTLYPREKTTLRVVHTLDVAEQRFRWEAVGKQWSMEAEAAVNMRRLIVFDGQNLMHLRDYLEPVDQVYAYDFAQMSQARTSISAKQYPKVAPIMLWLRPFEPGSGHFDSAQWKLASEANSSLGLRLQFAGIQNPKTIKDVTADPEFGGCLTKFAFGRRIKGQVGYTYDDLWGWVPMSWECDLLMPDNDSVGERSQSNVTAWSVNEPIYPSLFRLEVPVGTRVTDLLNRGNQHGWIQLEGGQRRLITPEEMNRGATYPELISSPSGEARKPKSLLESVSSFVRQALAILGIPMLLIWVVSRKSNSKLVKF